MTVSYLGDWYFTLGFLLRAGLPIERLGNTQCFTWLKAEACIKTEAPLSVRTVRESEAPIECLYCQRVQTRVGLLSECQKWDSPLSF